MNEKKIYGNTEGISNSMLEKMTGMYENKLSKEVFISRELAAELAEYTSRINREISVLLSRSGTIEHISVGDFEKVEMPKLSKKRSSKRLSGIRCIHTHPSTSGRLSSVDFATLSDAKFDAMAAIGVSEGIAKDMFVAVLTEEENKFQMMGPLHRGEFEAPTLMKMIEYADRVVGREQTHDLQKTQEYAILVGLRQEGMEELQELATTAGAKVVASEVQHRDVPDTTTYIGRGKVEELALMVTSLNADLVIVNAELSPIQQRNLEERLRAKVVDRTALILDIFAMRAKSKEGCLQVELAQMKYMLPRLIGQGLVLSRQAAAAGGLGIASRGPGETKLELDRRHIRNRIHALEQELKQIEKQRKQRRVRREESGLPMIALVGYTNAGKSTLLNQLTGADAYAEDKLFATLDPLTRKACIADKEVVLTDTVGFVQDLPHDLVEAFRSTLEEVTYADLLLHVVDGSNKEMEHQIGVVQDVLFSLDASQTPVVVVLNKMDIANTPVPKGMVAISAKTGEGIEALKEAIAEKISGLWQRATLCVPYSRSDLVTVLHESGSVISEEYKEGEMQFDVELPTAVFKRIKNELRAKK